MPWLRKVKVKYTNTEKPHRCKVPGCSGGTKKLAVGSVWLCRKCKRMWKVSSVTQFPDGNNASMTWRTISRLAPNQEIIRLSPLLIDY